MRQMTVALVFASVTLGFPATAAAHVSVAPVEVPADDYAFLDFAVPHGCDGSGTTELRVQIPKSVPSATPQVHPGWDLTTKTGPKDEVELFGETITEGVAEVVWKTQEPLPDGFLDRFTIEVKMPAGVDETIDFPVVQTCEKGKTAWIEIPAEGESEDDLEAPAPAVTLTDGETEEAATEPVDDGGGNGLAVAGLIVGALGLGAGGTALARSRKSA